MKDRRRDRIADHRGFTLLELIVVTLIIGILAALAIPQYAGYKSRAVDSQMQSAVKNARTAMEAYFVEARTYTMDVPTLTNYGYNDDPALIVLQILPVANLAVDYHLRACAAGGGGSFESFEFQTSGANAGQTVGTTNLCS